VPPTRSLLADPALRAALANGLGASPPPSPAAAALAAFLARAFGTATVAVIHYGSHAHGSDARPESAHDFFVVVDDYGEAYRSVAATVGTAYRPATAALLNRVLPPNVVSLTDRSATPPRRAKVAVLSLRDFRRACSARARDHFVRGRLFQPAQLVWARDDASRVAVVDAVLEARAGSFDWGHAYLPPRFDAERYCRVLLETSFAAEIRPEGSGRVEALLAAQRSTLVPMAAALLRALAERGVVTSDGEAYVDLRRAGRWAKIRWALYFRQSALRATLRWGKYVALYEGWLEYLIQKVARRSGVVVELTARERRWPLIFLWPKAIRFLRDRPQRRR
jgi:hypothetical protein